MAINVLICGCGNIGAMYDWDSSQVLTHAKAFSLKDCTLKFFDINSKLLAKVTKRYRATSVKKVDKGILKGIDIFCICTPTKTHAEYLYLGLESQVPVIVCEKPISTSLSTLNDIICKRGDQEANIVVNYIRRFQPGFKRLRDLITDVIRDEQLTNIAIRYQRGFINNCSHALDTIMFLTGWPCELKNVLLSKPIFDHFEEDATISMLGTWKECNVSITGLANVEFSHFEFDLYFQRFKISVREGGNIIEVFKISTSKPVLQALELQGHLSQNDCLKDYMLPVASHAIDILHGKVKEDNFKSALDLNIEMVKISNNYAEACN